MRIINGNENSYFSLNSNKFGDSILLCLEIYKNIRLNDYLFSFKC